MEFRNREIIENNFVFCLWSKPKIYGKYIKRINSLDKFLETDSAKFFYTIGCKLIEKGMTSFDQATVLSYIDSNEIIKSTFLGYGGYDTFKTVASNLDPNNVDGFYGEIIKMNIINDLEAKGFDIKSNYQKISQMSADEIRAYFSYQLNNTFIKSGSETRIEDFTITEEDFELFDSGTQMGLSIASTAPLLNYEILGLNRGLTLIGGHVNQGKAQPLTSKVLTPNGYKELGEVRVGEVILGYTNQNIPYIKQKITGIFPQGKKKLYKLIFSDGSTVECNDEHIWSLLNKQGKRETHTLKEFMEMMDKGQNFYMLERKTYEPPENRVLRCPYDLYAIGYMFGNRCNVWSGYLEFTNPQTHSKFMTSMDLGVGENPTLTATTNEQVEWNELYRVRFSKELTDWVKGKLGNKIFETKTFVNTRTDKKYVAFGEQMLWQTNRKDREKLLTGWLDSTSNMNELGDHYKVSTQNIPMLDMMVDIGRSLGWRVDRNSHNIAYFRKNSNRKIRLVNVIDMNTEVDMVCIKVSNEDELYITDNFIPTHNTSFSFAVIMKAWLNAGIKSCIISNEQTINEFKQLMIAQVSYELFGEDGLDRRRLKVGHFSNKEEAMFREIMEVINKQYVPYIKFAKIFNYSIEDVQMIIETLAAQGYGGFIYDVFKAEDSASGSVIGEMKEMSKELFMLADRTDSSIIATVQLGLSDLNTRFLALDNISTSKHISEPATEVLLIRGMWDDEITGGKHDIKIETPTFDNHGNPLKDKQGKPIMKQVQVVGQDYKKIKIVFLAKTRNTGQGIALAYKFNGGFNQWQELGYCYPSHENRGKK